MSESDTGGSAIQRTTCWAAAGCRVVSESDTAPKTGFPLSDPLPSRLITLAVLLLFLSLIHISEPTRL